MHIAYAVRRSYPRENPFHYCETELKQPWQDQHQPHHHAYLISQNFVVLKWSPFSLYICIYIYIYIYICSFIKYLRLYTHVKPTACVCYDYYNVIRNVFQVDMSRVEKKVYIYYHLIECRFESDNTRTRRRPLSASMAG